MRPLSLRLLLVLGAATLFASCDYAGEHTFPTDNVSGRWNGTGAYRAGGAYDAKLVFRQDPDFVYATGTVAYTDVSGNVLSIPYDLKGTYLGHTLTFPAGFGVATLSDDGRTLHWVFADGSGAFDLTRK